MDPERKTEFDALEILRQGVWTSYNTRRNYEWKLALSLWTAIAAFIGIVLTGRIELAGFALTWGVAGIGVIVVILHGYLTHGIARAHSVDRKIARCT